MLRGQIPSWDPNKLSIVQAPAARDVYWIGVFGDSIEPEFTGYHPGVIIRGTKSLSLVTDTVSFVPITTKAPLVSASTGKPPPYIHPLSRNPNPAVDTPCWAVCNHVITVRLTRLERYLTDKGLAVMKVSKEDFTGILQAVRRGFGAFDTHVRETVDAEVARRREELEREFAERRAQLEAELEERAFRLLDDMTKPEVSGLSVSLDEPV